MPDTTPEPMPDKVLLVSRDSYLGVTVTGPGLDLRARHLTGKAGFVPHHEQDAMVLPPRTTPKDAEKRASRAVALLYFEGYSVTLDTTLVAVRPPNTVPKLGPATMAIHDAAAALRVMPHPVDAAALLDAVRTGPMAAVGAFLDTAVPRADAIEDSASARDAQIALNTAAEHLAAAETALMDAAAVLRANAPAPRTRVTQKPLHGPASAPTPQTGPRHR